MEFDYKEWESTYYGIVDERFAIETDLFKLHIYRKDGIVKMEDNSSEGVLDIFIPQEWDMNTYSRQDKLRKFMQNGIEKQAQRIYQQRTDFFALRLNIPYKVKASVTGLGHCYGKCNGIYVKFNMWTICGLPGKMIDYLVCHELGHLYKRDHFMPFWRIVDMIYLGLDSDEQCTGNVSLALDKEFRQYHIIDTIMYWSKPSFLRNWFEHGMIKKGEPLIRPCQTATK